MRDLRQGVGLVHELRELGRAKEFLERGRDGLGIDQVVGHQGLLLGLTQTLFDGFLNPRQTGAVLVLGEFAHATHAAVAQVVNVIDFTATVSEVHQNLHHRQNVIIGEHHGTGGVGVADFGIELHSPNTRQIVGVGVVKKALEKGLHRIFGGRLARTHHAINRNPCSKLVGGLVSTQCLRQISPLVKLIGVNALEVGHT